MIFRSSRLGTLVRVAMYILMPLAVSVLMYFRINVVLRSYMESRVAQDAFLAGTLAQRELTARSEGLTRVAEYFRDGRIPEEQMDTVINWMLRSPGRSSCGIVRLDGTLVAGEPLLPGEYPAIKSAFHGNSAIRYREGEGFLFTSPVYNGKNIKYVLYEFFDAQSIFDGFKESLFGADTEMALADSSLQIVIPFSDGAETDFLYEEEYQSVYRELHEKMGIGSAAAVFHRSSSDAFWFTTDLSNSNNFYLIGRVSYSVVAENVRDLALMALLVFVMLLVMLTIGTFRTVNANMKLRESDELRRAKEIAEEASKSKSRFIANMSHELRTPINVILGMDEMILREDHSPITRERALDIRSAAKILLSLINDVLDFSKIESGKMNIISANYSLVAMIRDLNLMTENRIRQRSLNFEMEIDPELPVMLYGDDIHIRQVLTNLLTNAVKYTNEGTVTLKISRERITDDKITIRCTVSDTGVGIKQEDIDKLMIPYTRIEEERHRTVEGTGLGMSIIINLLKLMNARLNIESVYGKGSTFWFDIEQGLAGDEQIGDIQQRMDEIITDYEYKAAFIAPKARVLMVDDNSMNRKIFEGLLNETQINVTTASSGEKCLNLVKTEHYDIIFMDHFMPEMDGVETLERLIAMGTENLCAETPVIALTANAFVGDREKYITMGFDDFLSKPIDVDKLEAMIKSFLPPELIEEAPERTEEESPTGEELPEIDGVNRDLASLHFRKEEMFVSILKDFYRNIEKETRDITELKEKIDGGDDSFAAYRIRVHALKSTAAMVGIMSVSELAKLLEYAARGEDIERIERLSPVLTDEMEKTRERLRGFFGDDEPKTAMEDMTALSELLEPIPAAMSAMDIDAVDAAIDEINKYTYPDSINEMITRLSEKTSALDYAGAEEILDELRQALAGSE